MASFLVLSCNSNPNTTEAKATDATGSSQTIHTNVTDTVVQNATPMVLTGCYQMILKQDTARLNLTVKDTTVTGELQYDFHEKDRNTGTLQGVLRDDKIYADYTFQSEGMTSVREVVFKLESGTLLQGFGDLKEQDNRIVFQDKEALQFQTANPFFKAACQ